MNHYGFADHSWKTTAEVAAACLHYASQTSHLNSANYHLKNKNNVQIVNILRCRFLELALFSTGQQQVKQKTLCSRLLQWEQLWTPLWNWKPNILVPTNRIGRRAMYRFFKTTFSSKSFSWRRICFPLWKSCVLNKRGPSAKMDSYLTRTSAWQAEWCWAAHPLATDPTPLCPGACRDSDIKPETALQLKESVKPEIKAWNLPDSKQRQLSFWLALFGIAISSVILPISQFFKGTQERWLKTAAAPAVPCANTATSPKKEPTEHTGEFKVN